MTGSSPAGDGPHERAHAKIVLLTGDAGLSESLDQILGPEGHSLVRVERLEQVLAILERGTVDIAMIDLSSPELTGRDDIHAIHRAAGATVVVCLADDAARTRADEALKSGATRCLARPPARVELLSEIGRLLEVEAHRRDLAACEEGKAECVLRKPAPARDSRRARRRIVIAAVAVIIAALVAVPVVIAIMRSASRVAEEAKEKLDTVESIKGYLQRDEQRELESRGR